MSAYPKKCFFTIQNEAVYRNVDAQISTTKAVRSPDSWDIALGLPMPLLETKDAHEGGSRTPNQEIPLTYVFGESAPEFMAVLPGVWWYYVMGACATTGTDTVTTGRTVDNVAGQVITFSGAAVVAEIYAPATADLGTYVVWCTAGTHVGKYWYIADNGTNTITLLGTVPGTLLTDTIKVIGPPYTHVITMAAQGTRHPSFVMHVELEDWVYYRDLLGCFVESCTFSAKKGNACTNTPSIKCAKDIAGANATKPDPHFHTDKRWSWHKHMDTTTVTYDGDNIDDVTELKSWLDEIEITAENTVERGNTGGDQYATSVLKGEFKITLKFRYRMQGMELWTIRNTEYASYTTALAHEYKFVRADANDYIQFAIDKTKLIGDAKPSFPSIGDKELFQEFEFILGPESTPGALTVTEKNNYSWAHYEDGAE